jgi:3-dehydroquinate synthase class II
MFLQQAETVRVIGEDKRPKSITELKKGDSILGWCQKGARHIGAEISSNVSER